MKRIIATLLAMLMLFAALASAESLEDYITESGLPIVTDASKLEEMDILWVASPLCQLEPHEIAWIKQNEAETGMKFNWQKINSEGATEKMPVILSADELPDIIWNGISKDMFVQLMDQDIFMPVEDLIENHMPNLKKILDDNPQYKEMMYAPDGHIYGLYRGDGRSGAHARPDGDLQALARQAWT